MDIADRRRQLIEAGRPDLRFSEETSPTLSMNPLAFLTVPLESSYCKVITVDGFLMITKLIIKQILALF